MKRAQVQFMEMVFVLLILIIIIFIGMFFYFSFSLKNIEERGEELTDIDATVIIDSVIGLPEISCGVNCIDTVKVLYLNPENDADYYKYLFKNMKITIKKIYPGPTTRDVRCIVDNYPLDCDYFVVNEMVKITPKKEVIQNAVPLYYPLNKEYAFGLIRIEVFK